MTSDRSDKNRLIVSQQEFDQLVEKALADIPAEFLALLDNVAIAVEDEPADTDLEESDLDEEGELLGIFRGIPTIDRSWETFGDLPGEIVLFRGPILRCCTTRAQVVAEVRDTVVHELGHYFGLDDHEMPY